jgi:hypothetical protein
LLFPPFPIIPPLFSFISPRGKKKKAVMECQIVVI